ncbi:hypothetical protein DL240_15640 [Lujinxingia litoralis]|uniref:Response regulatory domain-containing protein n=1 Tax=Lujinxingia litoralis TaxID=2211119 RepID=A0A328C837_9DELT|nr:response regulator [Lujinxingia litoralis]RAL20748.1 hypothetical protein DL240_15640 [Lujinxingia litoralis]
MATMGKVAVVDDEPMIGDIVARALKRNWEVRVFEKAGEALEALEEGERFDVFLCDVMMPGYSGLDLFEDVRRKWPKQAARVVFMSGISGDGMLGDQIRDEGVKLLRKPFELDRLREVVQEVFASEEARPGESPGGEGRV